MELIPVPFSSTLPGCCGTLRKDGAMEAPQCDNGGRRSGIDRRQFSYSGHMPERRSGEDRRSGGDRRQSSRMGADDCDGAA